MCDIILKRLPSRNNPSLTYTDDDFSSACEGLQRAQGEGGCAPSLCSSDGGFVIYGCDDSWKEPVLFCPFCGTALVLKEEEAK